MASRKHAIEKTISWRVVATLSTFAIVWVYTGDLIVGLAIGGVDALVKTILYYFHERSWDELDEKRSKK